MTFKTLLALLLLPVTLAAQQRNFVTCPIVRDTKTVPCFLAEYEGETYFLAIQQDIQAELYPPQLLHEVLVEGTVAPGPRVCGGIPLKPVKLSVLPEVNPACNTILPAEPGIEAPPTRRPAGPSTRQAPVSTAPPAPRKTRAALSANANGRSSTTSIVLFFLARYASGQPGRGLRYRGEGNPWRLPHSAARPCFRTERC